MTITRVSFIAFNQRCQETFIDKSPEAIHQDLLDVCSTYVPVSIESATVSLEFQPLSILDDFPRPEPKAIPSHLQWAFTEKEVQP